MKKTIIFLFVLTVSQVYSQKKIDSISEYRRSSLYTLMIENPTTPYGTEIKNFFMESPIPDKFNDHNLNIRIISNNILNGGNLQNNPLLNGSVSAKSIVKEDIETLTKESKDDVTSTVGQNEMPDELPPDIVIDLNDDAAVLDGFNSHNKMMQDAIDNVDKMYGQESQKFRNNIKKNLKKFDTATEFKSYMQNLYKTRPQREQQYRESVKFIKSNEVSQQLNTSNVLTENNTESKVDAQDLNLDQIARELVAKWFNRSEKGGFDMDLVIERGNYDANALNISMARASKRGLDMLADAGEELIKNTFVLVNDFKYVSKEEVAKKASGFLSVVSSVASAAGMDNVALVADVVSLGTTAAGKGYVVKTSGYLYQLDWNDEVANIFYNEYWADDKTITTEKKKAFEESSIFKLKYIGVDESWADVQSSVFTSKSEVELVERATMKAMDAVIVKLQKVHDQFKTKTPLFTNEPITAKIGLKEGLTKKSVFDVLEITLDENGKTFYKAVGSVKVDDKFPIWDNQFGAQDEVKEQTTDRTYFKKISGKDFYPGMLIVQKKGK